MKKTRHETWGTRGRESARLQAPLLGFPGPLWVGWGVGAELRACEKGVCQILRRRSWAK